MVFNELRKSGDLVHISCAVCGRTTRLETIAGNNSLAMACPSGTAARPLCSRDTAAARAWGKQRLSRGSLLPRAIRLRRLVDVWPEGRGDFPSQAGSEPISRKLIVSNQQICATRTSKLIAAERLRQCGQLRAVACLSQAVITAEIWAVRHPISRVLAYHCSGSFEPFREAEPMRHSAHSASDRRTIRPGSYGIGGPGRYQTTTVLKILTPFEHRCLAAHCHIGIDGGGVVAPPRPVPASPRRGISGSRTGQIPVGMIATS